MNVKTLFDQFNASKFVVFFCLLLFSVVLSLRLDDIITCSYWVVFTPLWLWKIIVLSGCGVGTFVWIRRPQNRPEAKIDFQAMAISTFLQVLLLTFEILLCIKLESQSTSWRGVFIPLFLLGAMCVASCVWGCRRDRGLELEAFGSLNTLQFTFLALRLDDVTTWKWKVVLIPLWIELALAGFVVLYFIGWAILVLCGNDVLAPDGRKNSAMAAIFVSIAYVAVVIFMGLLVGRVDSAHDNPFVGIFVPLHITLVSFILLAFVQKGGNPWWFGMRKDFCDCLFSVLPWLQEYGNISYSFSDNEETQEGERPTDTHLHCNFEDKLGKDLGEPVIKVISIAEPD